MAEKESHREGKEKRAVSREEQEVAAAEAIEAENDGRRGTSLAHRRTQGANAAEQSADTCPPPSVIPSALLCAVFQQLRDSTSRGDAQKGLRVGTYEGEGNLYFDRTDYFNNGCLSVFLNILCSLSTVVRNLSNLLQHLSKYRTNVT